MEATALNPGLPVRLLRVVGVGALAILALTSCLVPPERERIALGGDDCLDGVRVELDRPLADRALVDLTSGRTVRVDGH